MANRRISDLPAITSVDIADADLFTIVHVSEVDPGLKNKQFTVAEHRAYLNNYYLQLSGGTIVNDLTIGDDLNVSGDLTVAQNMAIVGTGTFGTLIISGFTSTGIISGVTITGTNILGVNVNGNNGYFGSLQAPIAALGAATATTLSGGAITGNTIAASGITGQTITGNNINGLSISGTTITGVTGVFTTSLSGALITGNIGNFANLTGVSGTFTSRLSGAVITGNTGLFNRITGVSGVFTSEVSGAVITAGTGQFTQLNAVTGQFIVVSGATVTGASGVFTNVVGQNIEGTVVSGTTINAITGNFIDLASASGIFVDQLSGAVITGETGLFNSLTVGGINITGSVSGGTITGTSGQFITITAQTGIFTDTISIPSITTTGDLSASGDLIVKGSGYISSGLVVSGTISGNTVTGETFIFNTATGSSLNATGLISGVLITGNTIQAGSLTGVTGTFTSLSGALVTGNTVSATTGTFVSGVFTALSGTTITGATGIFGSITGATGTFTTRVFGATVTGNTGLFGNLSGVSGVFTNLSGNAITGNTISGTVGTFTTLNATYVNFTATSTGNIVASGSGIFNSGLLTSGSLFVSGSGTFGSGLLTSGDLNVSGSGIFNSGVSINGNLFVSGSGIFGSGILSSGAISATSFTPTGSVVPVNGIYLPSGNTVAISTSGTGRFFISDTKVQVSNPGNTAEFEVGIGATGNNFAVINLIGDTTYPIYGLRLIRTNAGANADSQINHRGTGPLFLNAVDAGNIHFKTSNSERLRITSDGKVGIGTSAPSQPLTIRTSVDGHFRLEDNVGSGYNIYRKIADGILQFDGTQSTGFNGYNFSTTPSGGSLTSRLFIANGGNVGIGTTSPGEFLHCQRLGSLALRLTDTTTANTEGSVAFSNGTLILDSKYDNGNGVIRFGANSTVQEYGRFDTSGRLLVGTSTTSATTSVVLQGNSAGAANTSVLILARGEAAPVDGASLGVLRFADSGHTAAANILAARDGGTWTSSSSQPSRLVFSTTADGASSPTERMRISQNGVVTVKNGAVAEIGTLADAATITPDFAANCNFTLTISGNRTLANPTNITAGQTGSIFIIQGSGSNTLSWGSYWDFIAGAAPTLSTVSGAVDRIDYIVRSSTSIHTVFTANYS